MFHTTDIARNLATELGKDPCLMAALVGEYVYALAERPALYRFAADKLTDAGVRVVAGHIRELNAAGTLDFHLHRTQAADRVRA